MDLLGVEGAAQARHVLGRLYRAAVEAALPRACLAARLPEPPRGRTVVVGAGKAAAAMAQALEAAWPGPLSGLVITRHGHGADCRRIEVVEAAHPVPDEAGLAATDRLVERVSGLGEDDLVLCLLSGGGSALLTRPAPGVPLADKQAVTRALLKSGAPIAEINCVRKHLSAIKGGRLAELAAPARVVTLAVSDVPGDDPSVLASGPTTPDPTTRQDAAAILARYVPHAPASVTAWLADPASETPKPDPQRTPDFRIIASPALAIEAAKRAAEALGYAVLVLGPYLEGEAREVARAHAGVVRDILAGKGPVQAPCVVLSGGETTVTVRGPGRGGRNAEFLLALAVELDGTPGVEALACDTDGIDGSEDNAGAMIGPDVLARAAALGVSAKDRLAANDAHSFFEAVGGLVFTGPTRTNVNDFRAILIERTPA
ncbi:glycerate kinase [Caulobacter sp. 17J80-11]|uniref:glycerate kinase type-2 family protein n=1 Tax=Caulobacter sp. 17J80-11 TaxID=2763502 RepID=UPI0016536451|nr:glycerate kinase [Caulobacter sp. 17J80-11]MBC6982497.1 glycerate kinase [Caulobacter sp. 17J80-11]